MSAGRWLLMCGVVGAPINVTVFTVEGAVRPGYSPIRDFNSFLSLGPQGWVNIANFIVFGVLMLAFAAGVRMVLRDGPAVSGGPALLAAFGASLVVAGLFVADPGPTAVTVHGAVHMAAGIVSTVALTAACFVFAGGYPRLASRRYFSTYSRVTGIVVAVLFVASVSLDQLGVAGLVQRIAIIAMSIWIVLLGVRLIHQPSETTSSMYADPA